MTTTTLIPTHMKHSTTNSMILDYLFYQSIQSRLQKAFVQDEISDNNAIESVIDGTDMNKLRFFFVVVNIRFLF